MQTAELERAMTATKAIASSLGLRVDDAIILNNSNKLALHLVPCDVMARVAPVDEQVAGFEIELAQRLGEVGSPVAALDPRVEPLAYERDGFVVTLWTYYEPVSAAELPAADFARALEQLHAGMRKVDIPAPHFTDRVAEAQQLLADHDLTPELPEADRKLLSTTLRRLTRSIEARHPAEQLLHGEPHPGNLLTTTNGSLFIDLETCCRGPIEFDLAHAPDEVADHYPDVDHALLRDCRILMLAMVTTWRWDKGDQLPNGRQLAAEWLSQIHTALAHENTESHS